MQTPTILWLPVAAMKTSPYCATWGVGVIRLCIDLLSHRTERMAAPSAGLALDAIEQVDAVQSEDGEGDFTDALLVGPLRNHFHPICVVDRLSDA